MHNNDWLIIEKDGFYVDVWQGKDTYIKHKVPDYTLISYWRSKVKLGIGVTMGDLFNHLWNLDSATLSTIENVTGCKIFKFLQEAVHPPLDADVTCVLKEVRISKAAEMWSGIDPPYYDDHFTVDAISTDGESIACDFTPLYQVNDAPLFIDNEISLLDPENPDQQEMKYDSWFEFGQLMIAIWDEFSFYGSPDDRDETQKSVFEMADKATKPFLSIIDGGKEE
jgi:hypothetical protein